MTIARLSLLATLILSASCLDDAPAGPGSGRAQVALSLQGVLPGAIVEVRVFWIGGDRVGPTQPSDVTLATARVTADSAELRIPLVVDLRPCLPRERTMAGAWCDVYIDVRLLEGGVVAVSTSEGPLRLAPGGISVTPRLYLALGNTPPTLTLVDRAVRVEDGLIRVRFAAGDADGDLIGADAILLDTAQTVVAQSSARLPGPYIFFDGGVYLPVAPGAELAALRLSTRDTRGNSSSEVFQLLAALSPAAPLASEIAGAVRDSRVDVSFQVTDPQGDADVVDVVFRNVVDGEIVVPDTIYGICRRSIQPGNGRKAVSCPRIPGVTLAELVVVPFDAAGNWGRASRCAMSSTNFSCGGQVIVAGADGGRADAAHWAHGEHRQWEVDGGAHARAARRYHH